MHLPHHNRSFFNSLLIFTREKSLHSGKALHALIIKTPIISSCPFVQNSLINFYAKCNLLPQAHLVFHNIPSKDVVSYNCLINAHCQLDTPNSPSILQLFHSMRRDNILPNAHTFSGFFANLPDPFAGKQAHGLAVKTESFYDVFVGSTLMNFYCKSGFLEDAYKVFDEMPERNAVSWATMISGFASERMVSEALGVFELMRKEGEDVNEFALTSVLSALVFQQFVDIGRQIHCLAVKNGLLVYIAVSNALVTMYAKCGSLDESLRMFELSNDKSAVTWSAMITGCAQNGDSRNALNFFSKMHCAGIFPSKYTLVGVLNACSDAGAVAEGKQVHNHLLKLGYEHQMYILTALVDMYAKCGCTVDARKGFDCLREADIVLWTSMMAGYVQNGENEEALSLYGTMLMEGIFPNELTMSSIIKACSNLAALDQGMQIHARTIKYGLSHEVSIGSALSNMYSKCGSLKEGNLVFRRMPERDVIAWNAMISGLSQNGRGKEALELFEEMRLEGTKPDSVTFVNILSACSHMGLVERGWSYFNMMSDELGIVPRLEHYACMVDILSRAGKLNEARTFIESATIDHGLCLWRILLSACRNYRNYELGAYAGEKLMELGSQESSAYVLLSSIYTAMGRPEDVERVRAMMRDRGVNKEPGCSWIELKSRIHVFVAGDQMHPLIGEVRAEVRGLSKQMKDEGYRPAPDLAQ